VIWKVLHECLFDSPFLGNTVFLTAWRSTINGDVQTMKLELYFVEGWSHALMIHVGYGPVICAYEGRVICAYDELDDTDHCSSQSTYNRLLPLLLLFRVVPSRNWKTWNPEPRTWPGFRIQVCSKPEPEKWCDDVTKSSHLYQVPVKSSNFWKYQFYFLFRNLAVSHWNVMFGDENVSSHLFFTVPHSNPGPGSAKISARNDFDTTVDSV